MDWQGILQASLATIVQAGPQAVSQHWNGSGPDGKLNNALQIVQDAAQAGASLQQNLAASDAAQNPHPEIAAAAGQKV